MGVTTDTDSRTYSDVPDKLQEPYEHGVQRILREVWDRINHRNEHFMGVIVGREGTGKSHTAIKIACELDPEFTADQVYFQPANFLRLLRDDEYRPGAVYIWDEAGVGMGNRTWHDKAQILVNKALQLIRNHNIGLIFTLPKLGDLDSKAKGRLQAVYGVQHKKLNEFVKGQWYWFDQDYLDISDKDVYYKYHRTPNDNRIKPVRFKQPPKEVIGPYEEKKSVFQEKEYDEAIEMAEGEDGDEDDRSPEDIAEIIRQNEGVEYYIRVINNGSQKVLDKDVIGIEYDIGQRKSKRVKSILRNEVGDDVM